VDFEATLVEFNGEDDHVHLLERRTMVAELFCRLLRRGSTINIEKLHSEAAFPQVIFGAFSISALKGEAFRRGS
jgi:hypothetical protein